MEQRADAPAEHLPHARLHLARVPVGLYCRARVGVEQLGLGQEVLVVLAASERRERARVAISAGWGG